MTQRIPTSGVEVPPGQGRAVELRRGQQLRVVDVDGGQVGDVFAFAAHDMGEYLSAPHTRTTTGRLFPRIGEDFVTNRRRPILKLSCDTSPGLHDMLVAACDPERYHSLGVTDHRSCADNLHIALAELGLTSTLVPQPVNVFMNIPVSPNGDLNWLPAPTRPGDSITFTAAMDCVVVLSACPMDLNPINGERPTALALDINPRQEI
ncbi:urea carboxylase-associated family protein [Mycolicibacterium vanbaalenii]|uniref:urea carboxylase-associated family protein n=1 Tax=Mycolicibacterium vanbaalenii TaxID=110539 RepID=UPI0023BA9FE9|nr:urea carboxylase-associated family protein [Mycolicibacterium vanbaalenii]